MDRRVQKKPRFSPSSKNTSTLHRGNALKTLNRAVQQAVIRDQVLISDDSLNPYRTRRKFK